MIGLAQRRHDKFRMRKHAERILKNWGTDNHPYPAKENSLYMADNMQKCSCYGCGNARKHFGELTMQEKRANCA